MLWTIFVVLLILWVLGIVTSYTLYGYIHLLLLIAVVRSRDPFDSGPTRCVTILSAGAPNLRRCGTNVFGSYGYSR